MERLTPIRNWKYVHHHRKHSYDSMDNSVDSVQSSKSGKFNRFQFKKEEKSPLRDPREPIFTFTGKAKDRPNDRSILSKNSLRDREEDTGKFSYNYLLLNMFGGHPQKTDRESNNKIYKETPRKEENKEISSKVDLKIENVDKPLTQVGGVSGGNNVKQLAKQVKGITYEFKKVINLFTRKYKDMRYEWDRSFKVLLSTQLAHYTQAIAELKLQLYKKQYELDNLSKNALTNTPFVTKTPYITKPLISNGSTERLAISKVYNVNEKYTLSRNNTIAEFLSAYAMKDKEDRPTGLELRNMRQTIKRMQQILDEY